MPYPPTPDGAKTTLRAAPPTTTTKHTRQHRATETGIGRHTKQRSPRRNIAPGPQLTCRQPRSCVDLATDTYSQPATPPHTNPRMRRIPERQAPRTPPVVFRTAQHEPTATLRTLRLGLEKYRMLAAPLMLRGARLAHRRRCASQALDRLSITQTSWFSSSH